MSYVEPALPLFLLLGFIGLIWAWRAAAKRNTPRPWLQAIALLGLLLVSMNTIAWLSSRPLEAWYAEGAMPSETADAIVVLAGYVHRPLPDTPYAFAGQDTYVRLQRAAWLFKNWKAVPVLASGGGPGPESEWYGSTMRHVLESEGIPPDSIWIESRSRSTRENALFGAEILRSHGVSRIALVVEAKSMPRAAAVFRKLGFSVVPAPARYTRLTGELSDFLPNAGAIESNEETLHEMVGFLWYRLRGWI